MPIAKKYCLLIWEIESHLNQYQGMWDGNLRWENKKICASLPSLSGMLADKHAAAFPYTMRSQRRPASRLCSLPSLWKAVWQCRENLNARAVLALLILTRQQCWWLISWIQGCSVMCRAKRESGEGGVLWMVLHLSQRASVLHRALILEDSRGCYCKRKCCSEIGNVTLKKKIKQPSTYRFFLIYFLMCIEHFLEQFTGEKVRLIILAKWNWKKKRSIYSLNAFLFICIV